MDDLKTLCEGILKNKTNDARYVNRLRWEIEETIAKNKTEYFLDLYRRKVKYPINQNNLLIVDLLKIAPGFSIDKNPNCVYGEFPDIDIDYLAPVRDYIKTEYIPREFGEDYVCNISSYTTFGIKSSFVDMARVHGESREEIQALTKDIDAKDEEGKAITWDTAMKQYPDLKKYCEDHPAVAEAARKLINRNRGMGVHAGGLIISSRPLYDLVPLVKRKDSPQASAWVEGLHGQDLQPIGLVKFDLLVIANLMQIARCCELIKSRKNIQSICALPGLPDWTNVDEWRNDKKALAMANAGDLKGIFQFDADTVRKMAREGGVDGFEDLSAYNSLNRPGCLNMKLDKSYIERKRGREKYFIHPILQPILEKTYGIALYQEQVMQMLHVIGEIPLTDCEAVRKAISKKKVEGFIKYKEMFIRNGQKNLNAPENELEYIWKLIESWSEYGFNKSHSVAYTYISSRLLYLKAHYPHEFYAAILSCEKETDKIKEYKIEAKMHDVAMHRVDVNKSKVTFALVGDEIYYGLSNIKGIGPGPAERIVAGQPYSSFEDFLNRFGTDLGTLKPLIALRCFQDADPITLWKFLDAYRDSGKKNVGKSKRYYAQLEKYQAKFEEMMPRELRKLSDFSGSDPFSAEEFAVYDCDEEYFKPQEKPCGPEQEGSYSKLVLEYLEIEGTDDVIEQEVIKYFWMKPIPRTRNKLTELKSLWKNRQRTIDKFNSSAAYGLKLATFNADKYEIDSDIVKELRNPVECEKKYLGFAWVHELEKSPDYKGGFTFDMMRGQRDSDGPTVGVVEMILLKVIQKKTKNNKNFWQLLGQDVAGEEAKINVWEEDWKRWGDELKEGNLVRLRLSPPNGGFPTFGLEGNFIPKRWGKFKYNEKSEDPRVMVLRPGEIVEEKFMTTEEALAHFENCTL